MLIVLREGAHGVETLLIERSERAEDPASGQVSLPGGRVDGLDTSLRATALREAEEEVGVGAADLRPPVRFVGVAEAPRFGLRVGVFAAAAAHPPGPPLRPAPAEVAAAFWLPARSLAGARSVPRPTAVGWREVEAVVHDGHVLWGFTLGVLRRFFGAADGVR